MTRECLKFSAHCVSHSSAALRAADFGTPPLWSATRTHLVRRWRSTYRRLKSIGIGGGGKELDQADPPEPPLNRKQQRAAQWAAKKAAAAAKK